MSSQGTTVTTTVIAAPIMTKPYCVSAYNPLMRARTCNLSSTTTRNPMVMYQNQKRIQKTVGVATSLYTDNLNVVASTKRLTASATPPAPTPIEKHDSYARFLNKKKGKSALTRCINPTGYDYGDAIAGNKLYSTNIVADFSCNNMVASSIPFSPTSPQYLYPFQSYLQSQDPSTIRQDPYDALYNYYVGSKLIYTGPNYTMVKATIVAINNDGTYMITLDDFPATVAFPTSKASLTQRDYCVQYEICTSVQPNCIDQS